MVANLAGPEVHSVENALVQQRLEFVDCSHGRIDQVDAIRFRFNDQYELRNPHQSPVLQFLG